MKEFLHPCLSCCRTFHDAVLQPSALLQHLFCGASTAITIAVTGQHLSAHILILIPLPGTHELGGILQTIISGGMVSHHLQVTRLLIVSGRNQMCQHFRSVNALPEKGVVRKPVELIPSDFRGHKIRNPGFLQDLRQRRTVTKDIRQPQYFIFLRTELLFKKSAAIDDMPDQGFSGGNVAVRLQPHGSFRFPSALFDPFPDSGKYPGSIFLHELIELWLTGHKTVFRISVHQVQYRLKAAHCLLSGLTQGPFPCHINMGMADTVHRHRIRSSVGIISTFQILRRHFHALKAFCGSGSAQIQQIYASFQCFKALDPG